MAHCAEIKDGIVVRVIVVDDMYGDITCEEWCEKTYGGIWKKTSYNTLEGKHLNGGIPLRKNYAGIGYTYDSVRDAFIPQKPFRSWLLNEEKCQWEAPVKYPNDGKMYDWDENILNWILK